MPRLRRMNDTAYINRVIAEVGGIGVLADALGVKQPTVYQWRRGDRKVPPRLALIMQRRWPLIASAYLLRPDIFGPAPEDTRESNRD